MKHVLLKWTAIPLVLRIVCGLVVGLVLGITIPTWTTIGLLGTFFVNALKAIAPLLVCVLVVSSLANAKDNVGKRFTTVITLYIVTTLLAAFVAVLCCKIFPTTITLTDTVANSTPSKLVDVFRNMLHSMVGNPIKAIAEANYLGVLFWAILIGLALKKIAKPSTLQLVADIADGFSKVVGWVIQFAPFGVLGLVFIAVSENGLSIFAEYGHLIALLVGCMLFVAIVVNPFIAFCITRRNPYPLFWQCFKESGVSAFFTRSSAANIPVNMQLCERLKLHKDFYSVSIPLGATINMDGAAVTITIMTLTLCHTLGIDVSIGQAILLCVLSTFAACGTSGVPGGSLLLIPMAASLFGISNDVAMQMVGVGFIIGVVQDSIETALNSSSDVFFTAIADIKEQLKEKQ